MKNARRSIVFGGALIVLLTALAYLPALRGGFVFDDQELIAENRMVQVGDGLYRFWFTTEAADYYPLTWSLWWLEWRLWGANPMGYHVVNVLLHVANAFVVWMILRRLQVPGAWLAAAVFAVHPVNVATVAWISEQKNTLSMLFYALAILLYLRFDEDGRWGWYGLSLTAFLMALLSKTAVVMLPVVLLGCAWWQRGRVRRKDWLCSVPFFVLSFALGLVTVWFQLHHAMGGHAVLTGGFAARLAMAGWVPWFYLSEALLPFNLTVVYPKWEVDASRWVSYVPGIIWIGSLVLFWWKRKSWGRPLLFGLGYFIVMLFPVLGFFDQAFYRYTLVADHWQYYSIIGVVGLVVAAGQRVSSRLVERRRYWQMAAGVVVLVALGLATWKRGDVYADEETLWRDNVTKNPHAPVAHYNWAVVLAKAGKIQDAIAQYREALRLNPQEVDAYNNLGLILWQSGKAQEAIRYYEQALKIEPNSAELHNNLGLALWQTGKPQEAIGHYERALHIKADYAEAHYNWGITLVRLGRASEAMAHFEEALQIKPDYPEAHYYLARVLAQVGKFHEAIGQYEQALRLKPDYAEAGNNLAWVLATRAPAEGGDPARAVTLAERACELTENRAAAYLDTLAAAYAAAGRFADATVTAEKAMEVAYSAGQPQLAKEINVRLELYRSGHAYHQSIDISRP